MRLGLAAMIVFAGLLAMAFTGAHRLPSAPERDTVRAAFAGSARVEEGDPVRIGGVEVGEVESVRADFAAGTSTVVMEVDESAGPVYADARAAIRWRTLLGGVYVVELERGTPASGRLGDAVIPTRRTAQQAELEDFLSIDRGGARSGLQTMPGELARAFQDPRALADLMGTLDTVAPPLARGMAAMRGEHASDLRRFISATARTVRALDTPTDDAQRLVAGTAATFETMAAREADLRRLIAAAPGVLRRTEGTLRRLDTTLDLARPLFARLRGPAGDIAPALSDLRPTVAAADDLLLEARPLLRSLRPAMSSLARSARHGLPLLEELAPSLERLDETILPFMGEVDPQTGHSAAQMIGPAFSSVGPAIVGHFDRNGHFMRFPSANGPNSIESTPCQPMLTNPDSDELAACESLQQAIQEYFSYQPFGPSEGTTPSAEERR